MSSRKSTPNGNHINLKDDVVRVIVPLLAIGCRGKTDLETFDNCHLWLDGDSKGRS